MKRLIALTVMLVAATAQAAAEQEALPSAKRVREALGLAHQALERERDQLKEEIRRLEDLKADILAEIERLETLRRKLQEPIEARKTKKAKERTQRIRRMAKSLAAMSPAAAAVALARMDDPLAVEMLIVMDGKKVGKILEAMRPERAAVLMKAVVERSLTGTDEGEKTP